MDATTFATGDSTRVSTVGISCSPGPVVFRDTLYVFHQGSGENGEIWYITSTNGGKNWGADQRLSNHGISYSPCGVVFKNKLYVFHHGSRQNGSLWYTTSENGTGWSADQQIPLGITDSPSAVVFRDKIYVFHQGSGRNGQIWYVTSANGTTWDNDQQITNVGMSGSPSAAVFKDKLYLFYQGSGDNGRLYCQTFDGSTWSSASERSTVGISASPSAVVFGDDQLYVFHRAPKQSGELWYIATFDGSSWDADMRIGSVSASWSPGAVQTMATLGVFYQGGGNNGQLWWYEHEEMEIIDVEYHLDRYKQSDPQLVDLRSYGQDNPAAVATKLTIKTVESTEESYHFETSETSSISLTVGKQFKARIPVVKKKIGFELELGLSVEETRTYGETKTFKKEYACDYEVPLPPYTSVIATITVDKCTLEVPYTMTLRTKSGATMKCEGRWGGLTSWNQVCTPVYDPPQRT